MNQQITSSHSGSDSEQWASGCQRQGLRPDAALATHHTLLLFNAEPQREGNRNQALRSRFSDDHLLQVLHPDSAADTRLHLVVPLCVCPPTLRMRTRTLLIIRIRSESTSRAGP